MKYDIVIIGAGPAGYKAAELLGKEGKKVCLIDYNKSRIGGTCLNEGCIPVKSIIENADLYSKIIDSHNHGILCSTPKIDMETFSNSVVENINRLKKGIEFFLDKYEVDFIEGKAEFISNNTLKVISDNNIETEIEAENILIASGSKTKEVPGIAFDGKYICTSKDLVYRTDIPENIVILGGGVIGCEFATIYSKLGSSVTIIEMLENLLPNEDMEISRTLAREFKKKGIKVNTSFKLEDIKIENSKCILTCNSVKNKDKILQIESDCVLVSVGRKPNTENLKLEKAGIKTKNGFIQVNDKMHTGIGNIYAAGDTINTPMLAHSAYNEAEKVSSAILDKSFYESEVIPSVVFSDPQISSVGINEDQAKEQNIEYTVHKNFFKSNGMAVIKGKDSGFIKIISKADTEEIIGASIIGFMATELIHELALAVHNKLKINNIKSMIHAHPTLAELIKDSLTE